MNNNKLLISENHIYQIILRELNNNKIGVKFMLSDWLVDYESTNQGTMLIQRRALNNGRFDVISTFDETTYAENETDITPVGISSLNADYLAHPNIQEISYSPEINFLVSSDDEVVVSANRIALEEVRARLIQKYFVETISQFDVDGDGDGRIDQKVRISISSGEINYGSSEKINGRNYLVMSMSLDIYATNKGEFANQQRFWFGSSNLLDESGKPKLYEIPLLDWEYGTALDTDSTQLISSYTSSRDDINNKEMISFPNSRAYGLSFLVQIDFDNEFLLEIYLDSKRQSTDIPIYYILEKTFKWKYDGDEMELVEIPEATIKRAYYLDLNKPINRLSLGDKIEHLLNFNVSEKKWFDE